MNEKENTRYKTIEKLYDIDNIDQTGYGTIAKLYDIDKRKSENEESEKDDINESNEKLKKISEEIIEIIKSRKILSEELVQKRNELIKEKLRDYAQISSRLEEIKQIILVALPYETVSDKLIMEKDNLIEKQKIIENQIAIPKKNKKPKRLVPKTESNEENSSTDEKIKEISEKMVETINSGRILSLELVQKRNELIEKNLYKEHSQILTRLEEIKKEVLDAIDNDKIILDELVIEKDELLKRKEIIENQIASIKSKQPKKETEEENEIIDDRNGEHLSKKEKFKNWIKNLPLKVKIGACIAGAAAIGATIYHFTKGDPQPLADAIQNTADTVHNTAQHAAEQVSNHTSVDISSLGDKFDNIPVFESANNALNSHNPLHANEWFQTGNPISGFTDKGKEISYNDMSQDDFIQLIKDGVIKSVKFGMDAKGNSSGFVNAEQLLEEAEKSAGGLVK